MSFLFETKTLASIGATLETTTEVATTLAAVTTEVATTVASVIIDASINVSENVVTNIAENFVKSTEREVIESSTMDNIDEVTRASYGRSLDLFSPNVTSTITVRLTVWHIYAISHIMNHRIN